MEKFSRGYEKFGIHALPNGDIVYREWAPHAIRAYLIGDFSKDTQIIFTGLDIVLTVV